VPEFEEAVGSALGLKPIDLIVGEQIEVFA